MDVVRVDDGSLVSLVLDQEREEEERYFQEDLINEVLGHRQNVLAIQISSLEEMTGGVYLMRWRFRRVCWMSSMVKEVCYEVNSRERITCFGDIHNGNGLAIQLGENSHNF